MTADLVPPRPPGAGTCLKAPAHCGSARWQLDEMPESATACNCTACRRYGVLWAYGYEGENIRVTRPDHSLCARQVLELQLLPTVWWCHPTGAACRWTPKAEGASPSTCAWQSLAPLPALPIDHFDGLEKWEDLPRDGKCIKELWF